MAEQTSAKNREIEILRSFAIFFTLAVHLKVLLPDGSVIHVILAYVDLILVISGFVIAGSVLESGRNYHGPFRCDAFGSGSLGSTG